MFTLELITFLETFYPAEVQFSLRSLNASCSYITLHVSVYSQDPAPPRTGSSPLVYNRPAAAAASFRFFSSEQGKQTKLNKRKTEL